MDTTTTRDEKLQAMVRDSNGTKSEVLRKSLPLLEVALEATREGKKIGIADCVETLGILCGILCQSSLKPLPVGCL